MKKYLLFIITLIIISSFAYAIEPTQQSNKIFLKPFYRASMTNNVNNTYTVDIAPPDKISTVVSAIISFDVYITPTVTFTATVNGQSCNNPTYTVSTTFASSGQSRITFDCSNIINKAGTYNVMLRPSGANTGAVSGWIDLTYMNNPIGDIEVHGTEYVGGQYAKLWVQLINTTGHFVNNAMCEVDVYTPYNTELFEKVQMTNFNHDGIYYYDLQTPNIEGVYPVIAQCYYQATSVPYYATNYTLYNASFGSGVFSDTYFIDGNFMRFQEVTPSPRRFNMSLQFNNMSSCTQVSEIFLTSLTITLYSKFDSVANDDLTISIYNYSNNRWVQLPNNKFESNAYDTTSNTLSMTNITKAGFYNSSTQGVKLLFGDTGLTDGASSNFDIDLVTVSCNQLANPSWTEVKGSSEMHIANNEGYRYNVQTLCDGDKSLSSSCMLLGNPIIWDGTYLYEGTLFENISITNPTLKSVNQPLTYKTPNNIDCTGIINATLIQSSGTTNIINDMIYEHGTSENCILTIPVDFVFNESALNIELLFDNYLKWEVLRAHDLRETHNDTINFCNDYGTSKNFTFMQPLNDSMIQQTSDDLLIICGRFLDDIWYSDYYYNQSLTITDIGTYTSYHYEIADYYEAKIEELHQHITEYRTSNNINITAQQIWSYPVRNLTYYELRNDTDYTPRFNTIDTTLNNMNITMTSYFNGVFGNLSSIITSIANLPLNVWSYVTRDLTYYPSMNVTVNVTTQQVNVQNVTVNVQNVTANIQNVTVNVQNVTVNVQNVTVNVENVTVNVTTQQVVVNNLTVNTSEISDAVWNYPTRNLTFYPVQIDLTNYSLIQSNQYNYTIRFDNLDAQVYAINESIIQRINLVNSDVWTYTNRTLTYYPSQIDMVNYTLINQGVWEYVNRNLTYYEVNNVTAQDVWNVVNRTLTYYDVNNLTSADVWTYNNRTLTYYPSQSDLTNYSLIADDVWNYTGRYTHGVVLS